MNTNFTNRFDVMTADMLLDIEGGKVDWKRVGQCALSIGIGELVKPIWPLQGEPCS